MRFLLLLIFLPLTLSAQEVKLLSWNTYMFPKPVMFTKQGLRSRLITQTLKEVDHDIIVLQEAFSSSFRRKLAKHLKSKFPYRSVLKRGGKYLTVLNSGVFVLSRFPFKILEARNFRHCYGIDCWAAKGVMLIEVQHPSGKKLQMATTHLQAESLLEAKVSRASQFRTIQKLLLKHRKEGVAQILAGDLNVHAKNLNEKSEYGWMLQFLGMVSGPLTGELDHTFGYPVDCYKVRNLNRPLLLDHILINENGSTTSVLNRRVLPFYQKMKDQTCPLSDHYGLEAIISL